MCVYSSLSVLGLGIQHMYILYLCRAHVRLRGFVGECWTAVPLMLSAVAPCVGQDAVDSRQISKRCYGKTSGASGFSRASPLVRHMLRIINLWLVVSDALERI